MGVKALQDDTEARERAGIPADEPIFILRAQDALAVSAIARYEVLAEEIEKDKPDEEWFRSLQDALQRMHDWQSANSSKVRIPD